MTMVSHRPAPGTLFRSVSLRYQPRAARAWQSPARRGQLLGGKTAAAPVGAQGGSCRRDSLCALVEAALLVSSEPISTRRLCQVAGLDDATQARTLIRRLSDYYQREGSAFRIAEVAGGWQLLTHPSFGGWLRRLHPGVVMGVRLSAPAVETLAVVAYRQPVLRAEVESIRGVQCGEMLRQLMERDLVRIVGRSNDLGRPFLYGTTLRFLQAFGLHDLDALPRANQLRAPRRADAKPNLNEVTPGDSRVEDLPVSNHDLKEESHT